MTHASTFRAGEEPPRPPGESRLFDGIAFATKDALRQSARRRAFARGDVLFLRGALPSEVHVLAAGKVKMWRALEDGGVVGLLMLRPGDLLSAIALINRGRYVASATALTDVAVDTWPVPLFDRLREDDPRLARNLHDIVATRLEKMVERVDEVSGLPVEQRIARALTRMSVEMDDGRDDSGADLPLSRQDLAELTSTTLHTVSRILSRWRAEGLIGGGRGRILVRRLADLAEIARLRDERQADIPDGAR